MPFDDAERACLIAVLAARGVPAASGVAQRRLEATLASVLAASDPTARIVVFGERSQGAPESARLDWREPIEDAGQAARALAATLPGADLLCVRAGVRVPARWDRRLQQALRAERVIGSVSPLAIDDPLLTPLGRASALPLPATQMDGWLQAHAARAPLQMPRPYDGCCALRARARVHAADAGPDWVAALARAGWLHTVCTTLLVDAKRGEAADGRSGAGDSLVADEALVAQAHPLTALRHAVDALREGAATAVPPEPASPAAAPEAVHGVQLHIAHSWGGGLGRWVEDFCAADQSRENLVLRSIGVPGTFGQRLTLQRSYEDPVPLRVWELGLPIRSTANAHLQYRAILREIRRDFGVNAIVVSSLIGHSLDVLRTGLPTVVVTHDHYPLCVTIFAHFDTECRSCSPERLRECIAKNPGHAFFEGAQAPDFQALRESFAREVVERSVQLVSPSASTAQRWRLLMPPLQSARFEVVPHGVALPAPVPFEPPADGPIRLVILGRLVPQKGSELLSAMLPELAKFAQLTLLGCGDSGAAFAGRPGVQVVPEYTRETLPALVARTAPHLGLQLSIVPETFSYTLGELWHLGVPVLACRTGSLAERIRDGDDGWLADPDPAALLATLRELSQRRETLAGVRARLRGRPVRTTLEMVQQYHRHLPLGPAPAAGPGTPVSLLPGADAAVDTARIPLGAITVSAHATYATALRAFGRYTLSKLRASPRLPAPLRGLLSRLPSRWGRDDHRV
jgi:glycosyltransferase involved in cell wall biosynthesis